MDRLFRYQRPMHPIPKLTALQHQIAPQHSHPLSPLNQAHPHPPSAPRSLSGPSPQPAPAPSRLHLNSARRHPVAQPHQENEKQQLHSVEIPVWTKSPRTKIHRFIVSVSKFRLARWSRVIMRRVRRSGSICLVWDLLVRLRESGIVRSVWLR